jgi:hypothetical protein
MPKVDKVNKEFSLNRIPRITRSKVDNVKHPEHYTQGIEMWDYAYSHGLDFFEGNVLKYVTRWRHKNGMQDLLKAKQYLDKLIEHEAKKTAK